MGIIGLVLLPAIAIVAIVFVCIRKKQGQGSSVKSWRFSGRFSDRSSGVYNDAGLLRQTTQLKSYDRTISPVSDTSTTAGSGTMRKRRTYDKVYRTHEPLPDRPYIDFEEKDWDLKDEPTSPAGSDITSSDSLRKAGSPSKESDV